MSLHGKGQESMAMSSSEGHLNSPCGRVSDLLQPEGGIRNFPSTQTSQGSWAYLNSARGLTILDLSFLILENAGAKEASWDFMTHPQNLRSHDPKGCSCGEGRMGLCV